VKAQGKGDAPGFQDGRNGVSLGEKKRGAKLELEDHRQKQDIKFRKGKWKKNEVRKEKEERSKVDWTRGSRKVGK